MRVFVIERVAPGVAAHDVRRRSGFRVVYGPVRAEDLPTFLRDGNAVSAAFKDMRSSVAAKFGARPVFEADLVVRSGDPTTADLGDLLGLCVSPK